MRASDTATAPLRAIGAPHPATLLVAVLLAFGAAGNMDYADELSREAEAKERLPEIARRQADDAPRCRKQNAAGEWLRVEVASRSDLQPHWMYECHYQPAVTL